MLKIFISPAHDATITDKIMQYNNVNNNNATNAGKLRPKSNFAVTVKLRTFVFSAKLAVQSAPDDGT